MLAAPILIDRSMTNYWAGVSGKGNIINPRWRPNKQRDGQKTDILHHGPRPISIICQLPDPTYFSFKSGFTRLIKSLLFYSSDRSSLDDGVRA
jgi:hypothetical protein